ncbi:MAG: hypothetical protein KKA60_13025 [Proteobacteria bacterium]|nr:hypothetical protein [Pseudomonadota bacterium]
MSPWAIGAGNGEEAGLELFRRSGRSRPGKGEAPGPRSGPETGEGEGYGKKIRCAACGSGVTSRDRKTERGGSHEHSFFNPVGLVFVIGCFTDCPGCAVLAPRSTEFTWFPGHAWQLALCRACLEHLGWRYVSPDGDSFFGLILDRLVERD